MFKELHAWHAQRLLRIQSCCKHDMQEVSSRVAVEYEHGFFYNIVTDTCTKCHIFKTKNVTGW